MDDDCMICTEAFLPEDLDFPVSCPGKCGFNFCSSCLDHLIRSSKEDYSEASDGSRQVKVKLICPQCRADLSKEGPDVLRYRQYSKIANKVDSDLTASELRLKYAVLADSGFAARKSGANPQSSSPKAFSFDLEGDTRMDEFNFDPPIDAALLRGLQHAMSYEEQIYITKLMTSGDVEQIAQATQVLSSIQEMTRLGQTPSTKTTHPNAQSLSPTCNNLVSPTKGCTAPIKDSAARRAIAMSQTYEDANLARFMHRYNKHWKSNPLPNRMPVHLTLTIKDKDMGGKDISKFPIKFVTDVWDGSVADAFSRVQVHRSGKIIHKTSQKDSTIVQTDSKIAKKGWFAKKKPQSIESDHRKAKTGGASAQSVQRLYVSKLLGHAANKGVLVGDILTHINGERFENGGIEELHSILNRHYASCRQAGETDVTFNLVFNAEPAVASALKKRGDVPVPSPFQ